jgi:hypothetical protein
MKDNIYTLFENSPNTTINLCKSIKSRSIVYSVNDLKEFIELIKSNSKSENKAIQYLRTLERKSLEFDNIKKTQIPCAILHFNYSSSGSMISKNTKNPTGYLYFDIDNDNSIEKQLEENHYVAAYWKSVSGTGYGLAVRVSGINPYNYLNTCKYVRDLLNLPIDKNAHSIDRLTVLSYDPHAVYKPISTIINVDSLNLEETITNIDLKNETKMIKPIFRNSIYYPTTHESIQCYGKKGLKFNNLDEMTENIVFQYDNNGIHDCGKDKIEYINTYLPKKIKVGNREKSLGLYAKNLLYLNPTLTKGALFKIISNANILNLIEPFDIKEVQSIVDNAFDNQENFIPRLNKTKRFFFEDITLTPVEKSRLSIKVINEERRKKTQEKKDAISEIFCNWDCHESGKITPKKVIELGNGYLRKTMVYDYFKVNPDEVPFCD